MTRLNQDVTVEFEESGDEGDIESPEEFDELEEDPEAQLNAL